MAVQQHCLHFIIPASLPASKGLVVYPAYFDNLMLRASVMRVIDDAAPHVKALPG